MPSTCTRVCTHLMWNNSLTVQWDFFSHLESRRCFKGGFFSPNWQCHCGVSGIKLSALAQKPFISHIRSLSIAHVSNLDAQAIPPILSSGKTVQKNDGWTQREWQQLNPLSTCRWKSWWIGTLVSQTENSIIQNSQLFSPKNAHRHWLMCKCVNKAPCSAQKKCQSQMFCSLPFLGYVWRKEKQRKRDSPILRKSHNQPTLITLNETGRKLPTQFGTCILHQFRIIVLQVVISLAVIRVNKRKKRMFFEGQVVQVQALLTNSIPYLEVMQGYKFHQYLQWFTGLPDTMDYWIIVLYNLNMIMFLIPSIHPPSSCWGHVLRGTMSHRRTVQSSEPEANRLFLVGILCFWKKYFTMAMAKSLPSNLWCWPLGNLNDRLHLGK